jgi:hypothetical protein
MELEPGQRWTSLRASDADREQIVSALRQHHADGRLTVDEFTERMQRAFGAKTFGELENLTRDLPPLPPPLPEPPRPDPPGLVRRRFYRHLLSYAWVNGFMIVLWAIGSVAAGHLLLFWPVWTLLGWGLALGSHAIRAFGPQDGDRPDDGWRGGPRERRHDRYPYGQRRRPRSHVYH